MTLFTYIMTYELQVSNYHTLFGNNNLRHCSLDINLNSSGYKMYKIVTFTISFYTPPKREEGLEETENDKVLRSHLLYVCLFFLIKIYIKSLIFSNYRLKKRKNKLKLLYRKSQCNLNEYAHQKTKAMIRGFKTHI